QDGAAYEAGLLKGDEIVSVNGQKTADWPEVQESIQSLPSKMVPIEVKRHDPNLTVQAKIGSIESGNEKIGQLGIEAPLKTSFWDKVIGGFQQSFDTFVGIFKALGSLISNFSLDQLGGPVAIFELSSQAASQGATTVLYLTAMISINLGIMNLLPIPGLDGGKLLLNILEGLRGKPISQEKEGMITLIGFGLLMLLMVLVTWNDIQRFFF